MNTNQTKLTKDQKSDVKRQIESFEEDGGFIFSFPEEGTTVACMPKFPDSRMADFAIAIMGADETKFRKLVGADIAMARFETGKWLTLSVCGTDKISLETRAREFSEFVTY